MVLRYNSKNKTLYCNASVPIIIINEALKYQINFEIIGYEAKYKYVNLKTQQFTMHKLLYSGTSIYKDINTKNKKRILKKRESVFKGSVQHFLKSPYQENLKDEGYAMFYKSFMVNPWTYFNVESTEDTRIKKVVLKRI